MSSNSGTLAQNKHNKQQAAKSEAAFNKKGKSGKADGHPGGDMGKGMGTFKHKQAKFGKKPDRDGAPMKGKGHISSAAYHRSGGQLN